MIPSLFNLVICVFEWIQYTKMTLGHIFIHQYLKFKCTSLKCLNWMDRSAGILQSSANFASWWITLWIVNWFLLIRMFVCIMGSQQFRIENVPKQMLDYNIYSDEVFGYNFPPIFLISKAGNCFCFLLLFMILMIKIMYDQ